jgi:hypothetical protein
MSPEERCGTDGHGETRTPATDAVRDLSQHLQELCAFAAFFTQAEKDRLLANARNIGLAAGLALAAGLIALGLSIAAAVLLLIGSAQGLGILFGGRPWLGNMVAGAVVLASLALGAWQLVAQLRARAFRRTVDKYEELKLEQRRRFGRDVSAAAHGHN